MKKLTKILITLLLLIMCVFVGCTTNEEPINKPEEKQEDLSKKDPEEEPKTDPEEDPKEDPKQKVTYQFAFKNKEVTIGIGEEITIEFDTNIPDFDIDKVSYKLNNGKAISFQKNGNLKSTASGSASVDASYTYDEEEYTSTMTITITEEVKTFEKTDPRYWLKIMKNTMDVDAELMDKTEIAAFNQAVYSDYTKTKVKDLSKLELNVSGDYVKGLINNYTKIKSGTTVYKTAKTTLTNTEKEAILSNRNLNNISSNVTASYGIIVQFATMRAYPTLCFTSSETYNGLQETALGVGESVVIYSYSADKEWCFVQAEDYYGWIQTENVALCTKDEFTQYYRSNNYMVVIGERITINSTVLRMGDKLPYKSVDESKFIVYMPTKCGDNTLCINEIEVENNELVHDGFLTYTYTNLFNQGFKLLNTPYRWGDYIIDGRDCSSTQNAIYRCFGFVMPRNTSNQQVIPGYSTVVNGLNNTSMKNYKIGTLIFTNSHVMMYIGQDENGNCYLLHNSGSCKLQTLTDYLNKVGKSMIATLTIQ